MKIKKIAAALLAALLLAGCANSGSAGNSSNASSANNSYSQIQSSQAAVYTTYDFSESDGVNLILYFDYSENMGDTTDMTPDAITSASLAGEHPKGVERNNLLVIVDEIAAVTGADVFSVRANETHDPSYMVMVGPAQDDINHNRQFTFAEDVDLSDYDTVYVGMPVWWSRIPQPMKVFLENHDFSGKTVIPFGIHRGSRFGQMLAQLSDLAPDSTILDGYTVSATTANATVREEADEWLNGLK